MRWISLVVINLFLCGCLTSEQPQTATTSTTAPTTTLAPQTTITIAAPVNGSSLTTSPPTTQAPTTTLTEPALDSRFPSFITSNEDYYTTRIGDVPEIDGNSYRLEVAGLVDEPGFFTLDELYSLPQEEVPLTIECIGNTPNGQLLSTAVWKGFNLYEFLQARGVSPTATEVKFYAADGYFASARMSDVVSNNMIGALYMNDVPIPPLHGYPLRIINPGYHGVKHIAWVTKIEVLQSNAKDYWELQSWDVDKKMKVDSQIFFPDTYTLEKNTPIKVGGAAFGGKRITKVEVTTDGGKTWKQADIVKSLDIDNVWGVLGDHHHFPAVGLLQHQRPRHRRQWAHPR